MIIVYEDIGKNGLKKIQKKNTIRYKYKQFPTGYIIDLELKYSEKELEWYISEVFIRSSDNRILAELHEDSNNFEIMGNPNEEDNIKRSIGILMDNDVEELLPANVSDTEEDNLDLEAPPIF